MMIWPLKAVGWQVHSRRPDQGARRTSGERAGEGGGVSLAYGGRNSGYNSTRENRQYRVWVQSWLLGIPGPAVGGGGGRAGYAWYTSEPKGT